MTLLERLRELEAAATPGPWEYEHIGQSVYKTPIGNGEKICDIRGWGWLLHKHETDEAREAEQDANAEFITLSRNALPLLLAVAEAAKWVMETTDHAYVLNQAAVKGALKGLKAVLAKLEGGEGE